MEANQLEKALELYNGEYVDGKFAYKLMKVPTVSKMEQRIKYFIIEWAYKNKIHTEYDNFGNLYLTKGKIEDNEYYPCVTAHLDTVQIRHIPFIQNNSELDVKIKRAHGKTKFYHPNYGLGGDDKCGILICLSLLEKIDKLKVAFFVQEEVGTVGSQRLNTKWFDNVGYVIGYDSPDRNRAAYACKGNRLFSQDFFENYIKEVCEKNGVTNFYSEPNTDVRVIREKVDVQCMNFGSGYYKAHTKDEYILLEDVDAACKLGYELINHLGLSKYYFKRHTAHLSNIKYACQKLYRKFKRRLKNTFK